MDTSSLITVVAIALIAFVLLVLLYFLFASRRQNNLSNLMQSGRTMESFGPTAEVREKLRTDISGDQFEKLKEETRNQFAKKKDLTLEEKFFQAGMFSVDEKKDFQRMRVLFPVIGTPLFLFAGLWFFSPLMGVVFAIMGLLVSLQAPFTLLDRRIKHRDEEIMFYLPLVIEQIAIGVSSSLDVGPCISRVVSMADERDSHNVVTELLRHTQYHVKSGVALEQALTEIGVRSGHTELKHAFMSLSQVARHGGEITRQLQELADAVAGQRETKIESKIKKLELEATGPVALVFLGFIVILLVGFGIQIRDAFQ